MIFPPCRSVNLSSVLKPIPAQTPFRGMVRRVRRTAYCRIQRPWSDNPVFPPGVKIYGMREDVGSSAKIHYGRQNLVGQCSEPAYGWHDNEASRSAARLVGDSSPSNRLCRDCVRRRVRAKRPPCGFLDCGDLLVGRCGWRRNPDSSPCQRNTQNRDSASGGRKVAPQMSATDGAHKRRNVGITVVWHRTDGTADNTLPR